MKKLCFLGVALLLAACGDDVSKSELKEAINESNNKICLPFQLDVQDRLPNENPLQSQLGASEIKLLKKLENGQRANQHAGKQMEALVRAGLYKADKEQRVGIGEQAARYAVYTMTERGREEIRNHPRGALLCVGNQKVKKIKYFSEPAAMKGMMVTHVVYDAKLQPEKWASSLLKDSQYKELVKESYQQTATLVKTNKGWMDIREFHR